MSERIPSLAHFVWFGRAFPWVNFLAIQSAAERGEFDHVYLHHQDDLSEREPFRALARLPNVTTRRLDPLAILERCPGYGPKLVDLFRDLEKPAARANVIRAAVLHQEGGIYLDLDTVTIRSLRPLREAGAFCGAEHIAWPSNVVWSGRPDRIALAALRMGARLAYREIPNGWRPFRKIEKTFPAAVNNAVLGATPGHAILEDLLDRMIAMPAWRRRVRFALGTHLLQKVVAEYRGSDFVVHPPAVFYPLGPEISQHWFRKTSDVALEEVLRPETRVVHWYASVATQELMPRIDPDYVRAHASSQLFSALALPFVESPDAVSRVG